MKAVNFFKALADDTRLRLVHLSLHYELNVNEIISILKMGQSRISRHLKILTDHHLVTHRRDGLLVFLVFWWGQAKEMNTRRNE